MFSTSGVFCRYDSYGGDPVLHQHYHYVLMFGKLIEIYPTWLPHVVAVAGAVMIVSGIMILVHFRSSRSIVDIEAVAEDEKAH